MILIPYNKEISVNNAVSSEHIEKVRKQVADRKLDYDKSEDALSMAGWGVPYHYTVTINNVGSENRFLNLRWSNANEITVGVKERNAQNYYFHFIPNQGKKPDDLQINNIAFVPGSDEDPDNDKYWYTYEKSDGTHDISIPAHTETTIEVITFQGKGHGGLHNQLYLK